MHSSHVPKQVKQRGLWIKATLSDSCSDMKFFLLIHEHLQDKYWKENQAVYPCQWPFQKTSSHTGVLEESCDLLLVEWRTYMSISLKMSAWKMKRKNCPEVKVHDVQIGFSFFDGRLEGWPGHKCWLIVFILPVTSKMASSINNSTCLAI